VHVLILTFSLAGIDDEVYRRIADEAAPGFADLPGLVAKTWLADPATNTYGGVYVWAERDAMEDYLESEVVEGLRTSPAFVDLDVRTFGTLDGPNAVTSPALAAVA
jgi:hypothetical protein